MNRNSSVLTLTLVLLGSLSVTGLAQNRFTVERERVLAKDGISETRTTDLFPVEKGMGKIFEQSISRAGASSLRLHFSLVATPQNPTWSLRIVDTNHHTLWSYLAPATPESEFWSGQLPGDRVVIEIFSIEENSSLKLKLDRLLVSIPPAKPQAITPPNDLISILTQTDQIKAWGRSVARLRFVSDSDGGEYVCTGFLVSPDLFLTNHHCTHTATEANSALVEFDYDSGTAVPLTLRFRELVLADQDLDFALLRLASSPGRPPLRLDATPPAENEALIIIQHPGGEPKQVSIIDCRVQGAQIDGVSPGLTDFGHLCDTIGGSSGSPAQDITSGRVIGLHHLGFRPNSPLLVNQAVRIGLIIDNIRQKRPDILAEMGIQ